MIIFFAIKVEARKNEHIISKNNWYILAISICSNACITHCIESLVTKRGERVVQIVHAATFSISVMDESCLPFSSVLCQLRSIMAVDYPLPCAPSRFQSWRADCEIDDDSRVSNMLNGRNFRYILILTDIKDLSFNLLINYLKEKFCFFQIEWFL